VSEGVSTTAGGVSAPVSLLHKRVKKPLSRRADSVMRGTGANGLGSAELGTGGGAISTFSSRTMGAGSLSVRVSGR
jgi:hypothetical protein